MENNVTENIYFILVIGSLAMAVLVGFVVAAIVYSQKRKMQHQNELQQAQIKHQLALLQNTIEVQEMERKRFAEDLHDDAGAVLSAVKLNLNRIPAADVNVLTETKELLDIAITGIRRVSHDLSPPALDQFGLLQATTDLFNKLRRSTSINWIEDLSGIENVELLPQVQTSVYRIVNELLNNAIKHSQATEVKVTMYVHETNVCLTYADNGRGFEFSGKQARGLGLKNMESRVLALCGLIQVDSSPGNGLKINISFPL